MFRVCLGWLACLAVFTVSIAVLVTRLTTQQIDQGHNYYGMPVGPILWSLCGIAVSISVAVALWQAFFGKPIKKPKGRHATDRPVDLTPWRKW